MSGSEDSFSWDNLTGKPAWLSALTGASALGVGLTEDPVGFVTAVIYEELLSAIFNVAGLVALQFRTVLDVTLDTLGIVGDVLRIPGEAFGSLALLLIETLNSLILGIALSAGPFGPLLAIVLWLIAGVLIASLARVLLEAIKWIS